MLSVSRRSRTLLTGLLVAVLSGPPLAGVARAAVHYVPWSSLLPGWTDEYVPSSDNDCVAGRQVCVKHTVKELSRVLQVTGQSCSHNAVFALAYTRITQTYAWATEVPGYFDDVPFANHQAAVFARYY